MNENPYESPKEEPPQESPQKGEWDVRQVLLAFFLILAVLVVSFLLALA